MECIWSHQLQQLSQFQTLRLSSNMYDQIDHYNVVTAYSTF